MAKYNWSPVTVRLVMSIPGTYEGWEEMEKFGMCRVGQVIKEEEWRPAKGEKAVVEYQVSRPILDGSKGVRLAEEVGLVIRSIRHRLVFPFPPAVLRQVTARIGESTEGQSVGADQSHLPLAGHGRRECHGQERRQYDVCREGVELGDEGALSRLEFEARRSALACQSE